MSGKHTELQHFGAMRNMCMINETNRKILEFAADIPGCNASWRNLSNGNRHLAV